MGTTMWWVRHAESKATKRTTEPGTLMRNDSNSPNGKPTYPCGLPVRNRPRRSAAPGANAAPPKRRTGCSARRASALRERDLGLLDGFTSGIEARFPEEAERRARLGKFYYRPPARRVKLADVAGRVRAVLEHLARGGG
jgi:probable phosphoglycerate mutase